MARKRTEPKSDIAELEPGRAHAPDQIKLNAISAERLAGADCQRRTQSGRARGYVYPP